MNIYKQIYLAGLALALASCASSNDTSADAFANTNDDGVICKKEPKVGSKLGKMVCTTRAEREEAARITQEQHRTRSRTGVTEGEISPEN
jgi:hypothetical protein